LHRKFSLKSKAPPRMDDSALYLGAMTREMLVLYFAAVEAHGEIVAESERVSASALPPNAAAPVAGRHVR
jgi:hypothetical protein